MPQNHRRKKQPPGPTRIRQGDAAEEHGSHGPEDGGAPPPLSQRKAGQLISSHHGGNHGQELEAVIAQQGVGAPAPEAADEQSRQIQAHQHPGRSRDLAGQAQVPVVGQSGPTAQPQGVNHHGKEVRLVQQLHQGADKKDKSCDHSASACHWGRFEILLQPGALAHAEAQRCQSNQHHAGEHPEGYHGPTAGDLHTLGVVPHRQHHQTQDKPCKPTGQREKQHRNGTKFLIFHDFSSILLLSKQKVRLCIGRNTKSL